MIKEGMLLTFILEVLMGIALLVLVSRARAGKKIPVIHEIAGLTALQEAVGRATEMGTPIMFVPGKGDLADAQTYAALPVLDYVAKSCAEYDTRIIVPTGVAVVHPVADAVTRQAFQAAGKGDSYRETDVRFINEQNWAWAAGITGIMAQRSQPKSCSGPSGPNRSSWLNRATGQAPCRLQVRLPQVRFPSLWFVTTRL